MSSRNTSVDGKMIKISYKQLWLSAAFALQAHTIILTMNDIGFSVCSAYYWRSLLSFLESGDAVSMFTEAALKLDDSIQC